MTFTGKNTDFKVVWDCSLQAYNVFYKGNNMNIVKYKFSDVKTYLD